jgi:peptide/nickel transport system permease protein
MSATPVLDTAKVDAAIEAGPRKYEGLRFALRNRKLVIGASIVLAFLLLAIVGPWLTEATPYQFGFPTAEAPNTTRWLGTTDTGQDVFSQFVYGLRATFLVGSIAALVGAGIGMTIGFTAGYRGGVVDELLMMFTNIILVIPVFAVLLIVAAYLPPSNRGYVSEALLIGAFSWPWVARATRAQTFSLASREFVSLARLSGARSWQIIVREIAPNMSSYLVLVLIVLFGGSILFAATLDFLGLGAPNEVSLGQMLFNAQNQAAITRGFWWWFIPPGLAVTILVGALYVANVGLDEVFNPKLRET